MKLRRRRFRYSLRSFLVVLIVLAVWLGVIVNRAREQREAVKAIEELGGAVICGWQRSAWQNNRSHETLVTSKSEGRGFRAWIQTHLGVVPFEEVAEVSLAASPTMTNSDVVNAIPHLQRMQGLKYVTVFSTVPKETRNALKFSLPNCQVLLYAASSGPNTQRTNQPLK